MKKTVMLRENYLFRRLYHKGKSYVAPCVAVYCRRTKGPGNRLGITATKKIGKAVARNRARRVILEAYRLLEEHIPGGLDIVIVARSRAVSVKMQTIRAQLEGIFRKL
jgi:ribonuclease P protein component